MTFQPKNEKTRAPRNRTIELTPEDIESLRPRLLSARDVNGPESC
jgi:hypothetical protein